MREWIILAESAHPFDIEPIIADLWNSDATEHMLTEYRLETGQDPYDNQDDSKDPDFEENFKEWFWENTADRIISAYYKIKHLIKHGVIRVWREITARPDWKPDERHLGIYWSWDKSAAEAHWGNYSGGEIEWLIEADVREENIDWHNTLLGNASPDFESECEVTIRPNAPVHLISVTRQ